MRMVEWARSRGLAEKRGEEMLMAWTEVSGLGGEVRFVSSGENQDLHY